MAFAGTPPCCGVTGFSMTLASRHVWGCRSQEGDSGLATLLAWQEGKVPAPCCRVHGPMPGGYRAMPLVHRHRGLSRHSKRAACPSGSLPCQYWDALCVPCVKQGTEKGRKERAVSPSMCPPSFYPRSGSAKDNPVRATGGSVITKIPSPSMRCISFIPADSCLLLPTTAASPCLHRQSCWGQLGHPLGRLSPKHPPWGRGGSGLAQGSHWK